MWAQNGTSTCAVRLFCLRKIRKGIEHGFRGLNGFTRRGYKEKSRHSERSEEYEKRGLAD